MKKVLFLSLTLALALVVMAGEGVTATAKVEKNNQEQLLAKRSRSKSKGFTPGWYTFIGHCNVRYAPSTSSAIAFTFENGEPIWVVKKQGSWYGVRVDQWDETIYWTHQQNLKRYYGPVTWG